MLTRENARTEALLLGLRQADGVDLEAYARLVGERLEREAGGRLADLERTGLVVQQAGRLRAASPSAWLLCDEVVARLA